MVASIARAYFAGPWFSVLATGAAIRLGGDFTSPRLRRESAWGRRQGCLGVCPVGVDRNAPQAESPLVPEITLADYRHAPGVCQ